MADKDNVDPLKDLEPWRYPVSKLPCFHRGEPKLSTPYVDLAGLMHNSFGFKIDDPTLGDVVTKILHEHGDCWDLRQTPGMNPDGTPVGELPIGASPEVDVPSESKPPLELYQPGIVPQHIVEMYSDALFQEFSSAKYASRIHASKLVLDGVKYTGVAIAALEIGALAKGTIQQLMKDDKVIKGFHLDAVTKIMMLHGFLELIGLVAHTGVVNSKYESHPEMHGLEYLTRTAKETGQTLVASGSDLLHNPYTRKNFAHCARYGIIAPLALQTFRTGHPIDQLKEMGHELSGVFGPLIGDLTGHLYDGFGDGKTIDTLGQVAKAAGAIGAAAGKPNLGKDLEGMLALPANLSKGDASVLQTPIGLQGAKLADYVKDPKQFERILQGVRTTSDPLGKIMQKRNSHSAQIYEAITKGTGNRFADFLTLMTTIAQGLYITDEAARSITIPAQAGFAYTVGNSMYEDIRKFNGGFQ